MLKFWTLFIVLTLLSTTLAADNCDENPTEECEPTEYVKYVECMRQRSKRDINCRTQQDYDDMCNCDNYNCNSCNTCKDSCNTCCSQCCNTISTCATNHCCHNFCHTSCRDHACRNSCKKTCREQIVHNESQSMNYVHTTNHTNTIIKETNTKHNITTIIHLNNMINNTNVINVPVVVNTTNYHNITVRETGKTSEKIVYQDNQTRQSCCLVIGPRQCVHQQKFPFIRCFHIRKKQCSPICLSPIIHYHQYEFCDSPNNTRSCQQQTIYIPQPRPRCAYHPIWPYVSCTNNRYQSCEGCYNHYMNPYEFNQCSSYCYDDGYGTGPYYRQGPFYRPGYANVPSCYQTGYCNMMNNPPVPPPNYPFYPNYGSFNNLPAWNLGYPSHTYDSPFIIDNIDNPANDSNQEFIDFLTNNPQSNGWPNFYLPPKDVSIEAEIIAPRSTRYAEIKIKADDEGGEEVATVSGAKSKEEEVVEESNEELVEQPVEEMVEDESNVEGDVVNDEVGNDEQKE